MNTEAISHLFSLRYETFGTDYTIETNTSENGFELQVTITDELSNKIKLIYLPPFFSIVSNKSEHIQSANDLLVDLSEDVNVIKWKKTNIKDSNVQTFEQIILLQLNLI